MKQAVEMRMNKAINKRKYNHANEMRGAALLKRIEKLRMMKVKPLFVDRQCSSFVAFVAR